MGQVRVEQGLAGIPELEETRFFRGSLCQVTTSQSRCSGIGLTLMAIISLMPSSDQMAWRWGAPSGRDGVCPQDRALRQLWLSRSVLLPC